MRAAIYARVSTIEQEPENQLQELRRYAETREWAVVEYIDRGVSGSKDRRPALDTLVKDAKRRRFDVLACWRLDRLGRNLRPLVTLIEELQSLGVAFVSLGEGIDFSTPAGKLQLHILAALAEFERARIQERVRAGLARARAQGVRLGRPRRRIDPERLATVAGLPDREAARRLGIPLGPPCNAGWPKNPANRLSDLLAKRRHSDAERSGPKTSVSGPLRYERRFVGCGLHLHRVAMAIRARLIREPPWD